MDAVIELPAAANSSIDTSRPVVVNPAQSAGPFSFDEVMGLMVDTIQAYGHELIRVRRKTTELQSMIRILEANLVGEVDGDLPDTPSGEGAVGDFNSVDTYIQGARRVAKKMYRPPLEQSPSLDIEFSQAELLRARVKSQSMKSFTEPNSPNQALALESLATPSPPDSARLNDGLNELPVFRSQSPDSGGQNSRNAPRGRRPSIVQQMNQRADDRDEEARAKMDEMQSEMKAMSETVQQMQNARLDDAAAMATVEAQNKEALKLQASESVMLKAMLAEAAAKEEASRAASAVSAAEGEEAVGKAMALAKKAAEAAEAAATRAEMIKTTSSPGVAKPNRQEIDPLTVDDPIATFAAKKAEEAAKKADDQAKAALKAELKGIKSDVSGLQEKLNNPKPLAPAAAAAPAPAAVAPAAIAPAAAAAAATLGVATIQEEESSAEPVSPLKKVISMKSAATKKRFAAMALVALKDDKTKRQSLFNTTTSALKDAKKPGGNLMDRVEAVEKELAALNKGPGGSLQMRLASLEAKVEGSGSGGLALQAKVAGLEQSTKALEDAHGMQAEAFGTHAQTTIKNLVELQLTVTNLSSPEYRAAMAAEDQKGLLQVLEAKVLDIADGANAQVVSKLSKVSDASAQALLLSKLLEDRVHALQRGAASSTEEVAKLNKMLLGSAGGEGSGEGSGKAPMFASMAVLKQELTKRDGQLAKLTDTKADREEMLNNLANKADRDTANLTSSRLQGLAEQFSQYTEKQDKELGKVVSSVLESYLAQMKLPTADKVADKKETAESLEKLAKELQELFEGKADKNNVKIELMGKADKRIVEGKADQTTLDAIHAFFQGKLEELSKLAGDATSSEDVERMRKDLEREFTQAMEDHFQKEKAANQGLATASCLMCGQLTSPSDSKDIYLMSGPGHGSALGLSSDVGRSSNSSVGSSVSSGSAFSSARPVMGAPHKQHHHHLPKQLTGHGGLSVTNQQHQPQTVLGGGFHVPASHHKAANVPGIPVIYHQQGGMVSGRGAGSWAAAVPVLRAPPPVGRGVGGGGGCGGNGGGGAGDTHLFPSHGVNNNPVSSGGGGGGGGSGGGGVGGGGGVRTSSTSRQSRGGSHSALGQAGYLSLESKGGGGGQPATQPGSSDIKQWADKLAL